MRYRIFPAADGACARFSAAHAGAGSPLDVAGVVFAGAGMGFIPVGYPTAPVVIQRCQLGIGGVIAAGAGIVGAPALFRAGGGFDLVMRQIVVARIDGQLLIGGVIADPAIADLVGLPAGLSAGGRFAIVGNQRMAVIRCPFVGGK